MTNITRDNIPDLNIELMDDEKGSLILLEQDSGGNLDRVCIHPVQLRYMAEKFGIIPTSDPQAAKHITMLERRIKVLAGRIEHLAEFLVNHSDHKHADLNYELTYANATADISAEFVAELDGVHVGTEPSKWASEPANQKACADSLQLSIEA